MKKTTPWEVSLLCWGCSSRIETIATLDGWETLCLRRRRWRVSMNMYLLRLPTCAIERARTQVWRSSRRHTPIWAYFLIPRCLIPSSPIPLYPALSWMLEGNTNSEIITILILVLRTFYQAFDSNQFCQPSLKRTYIISNKEFWSIKRCINDF